MIGILAKKIGMTQLFDEDGRQVPVTVLEAGPCYVTEVRSKEKHGYSAVQLGFGQAKEKRLSRAQLGHLKKSHSPALKFVREIRTEDTEGLRVGAKVAVDNFENGDFVDVEGVSIGKGFQGAVKRHGFRGAASFSHGDMQHRKVGSIGSKAGGVGCRKKVRKGKRLPGHMGDERITTQNLKVIKVDAENHLLAVRGSVPGAENGYVVVRQAMKRGTVRKWKVLEAESSKAEAAKPEGSAS
ncbi:MAG: 50S ribosomal protein L3 [Candidatus Omnitrophota bacterium]|jgi:large subunit ribosomal protein L3